MEISMQASRKEFTAAMQARKDFHRAIDDAKVQYAALRKGLDRPMQEMIDRFTCVDRKITQLQQSLPKTRAGMVGHVALPIILGIVSLGLVGLSITGLKDVIDMHNGLMYPQEGLYNLRLAFLQFAVMPPIIFFGTLSGFGIILGTIGAVVCVWKAVKSVIDSVQLNRLQDEKIRLQCTIGANPTSENCLKAISRLSSLYQARLELTQKASTELQAIHAKERRLIA